MQATHSLVPRLTDDQRRIVSAFTELREAMQATHWPEVDETDGAFRGWCSCERVGFPKRETISEAENDILEHLARQ
jgi:hypothetical protein